MFILYIINHRNMFCFVLKKSQFCFVWTFSCCMNKMRFVLKTNHDIARCDKTFFLWPMNQMGTTYTRRTRVVRKFFAIDLLLNKITHFRDVVENSAICLIPVTLLFIGVYFSLMRSIYCFFRSFIVKYFKFKVTMILQS